MTTAPKAGEPKDPEDFELIDFEQVRNWLRFVLHALVRRKFLALGVAGATLGVVVAALVSMPRTYRIEAQLLAQRNTVMSALGNPRRAIPLEADTPTRAASETVLRRDNLLLLMKQTDLLNRWEQSRSWLARTKDLIMNRVAPLSEEERVNAMIGFLERRLTVTTAVSTVTISLDWPDPQLGYQMVDAAVQNFMEQRHAAEVATIAETITILEGHAKNLHDAIESSIEDLQHAKASGSPRNLDSSLPILRRDPAAEAMKAEAAEVKVRLEAKRRAINGLDEFRRRRLSELQAELMQQRAVYADAHPSIAMLLQRIAALQEDSPQLVELRSEEYELMRDYDRVAHRAENGAPSAPRSTETAMRRRPGEAADDIRADYARTRLRFAMEKYDNLMERIDSARIELDTAGAAFKYRYSVLRPPTVPRNPVKPNVPMVLAGAMLVALALGTLAAALADLRSGRVLELWQVERNLGLEVLGQVPRTPA